MWYQGDSPVRTYLPQEKELEFVVSDLECGPRWPESLARYDPVTYSWRTAQCSLVEGLESYSEIFPQWGIMHDGEFWELTMSEDFVEENAFGYWPRPVATDAKGAVLSGIRFHNKRFIRTSQTTGTEFGAKLNAAYHLVTGKNIPPSFSEWMMVWPIGWTDLKPLAMDKFQQWQHLHGNY